MIENPKSLKQFEPIQNGWMAVLAGLVCFAAFSAVLTLLAQWMIRRSGGHVGLRQLYALSGCFALALLVLGAKGALFRVLWQFWMRNIVGYTATFDRDRSGVFVFSNWEIRTWRSTLPQSDGDTVVIRLSSRRHDPFATYWGTSLAYLEDGDDLYASTHVHLHSRKSSVCLTVHQVFEFYDKKRAILDYRVVELLNLEKRYAKVEQACLEGLEEASGAKRKFNSALEIILAAMKKISDSRRFIRSSEGAGIRKAMGQQVLEILPPDHPLYRELQEEYGGRAQSKA